MACELEANLSEPASGRPKAMRRYRSIDTIGTPVVV